MWFSDVLMPLISRWIHILSVILLVGGTLFMRLSLVPAALETNAKDEIREAIRRRWAKWMGAAILFLLASGLYNAVLKALDYELDKVYLALLMLKILLGLVVFFIASVVSGRSAMAKRFRQRELFWLNILCMLMVILVLMAGYMKMNPQEKKQPPEEVNATVMDIEVENFDSEIGLQTIPDFEFGCHTFAAQACSRECEAWHPVFVSSST